MFFLWYCVTLWERLIKKLYVVGGLKNMPKTVSPGEVWKHRWEDQSAGGGFPQAQIALHIGEH